MQFTFGRNWSRFLSSLTEERIDIAKDSLTSMLQCSDLTGKTFLDIGSGSGLFSLSAHQLGADVYSFDYDPECVDCTKELRSKYRNYDSNDWEIRQGSILECLSWLVGVAIVALLWAGVRDTNAYVLVMIALVIMATLIRPCSLKRASMMALCVWFVCIFALSDFSANTGNRWVFSFYNNIAQRILPAPEHVSYFSNHGMPVNPDLMMLSGKFASSDDLRFYRDPNLDKFRAWSLEHGKITYIKFLITHFTYTMTEPVFHVARDFLSFVYYFRVHPTDAKYHIYVPLSHSPIALIYFVIVYSVAICYAFVWWRRKQLYQCPYLAVPVVMILLSAPHAWITWHGDAMETARHTLSAFIQFQLGFILLLLYVWSHSRKGRIVDVLRSETGR